MLKFWKGEGVGWMRSGVVGVWGREESGLIRVVKIGGGWL